MVNSWQFKTGTPSVERGNCRCFLVLVRYKTKEGHFVKPLHYLNAFPLDIDGDCICDNEDDHMDGDGCPHTGWHEVERHPDYDGFYTPFSGNVVGYCELPDPVEAFHTMDGSPW